MKNCRVDFFLFPTVKHVDLFLVVHCNININFFPDKKIKIEYIILFIMFIQIYL